MVPPDRWLGNEDSKNALLKLALDGLEPSLAAVCDLGLLGPL